MSAATLQDAVDALTRLGCKPTKSGDQFIAFCPLHEADGQGHSPSLTLKAGDRQAIIVNCHAGCSGTDILKALGVNGAPNPTASIVASYHYQDVEGREVREKIRLEPKSFRIRHKDAAGNWVYKAGDGPPVLYRLPELRAAIAEGRTVFVCEGEKDSDRLASFGLAATTNIEGAAQPEQKAKWRPEYTAQLSGAARVVLLPDNDPPGRAHMAHIAQQIRGKVGCCQTIQLPVPAKGDVSDWLDAGHTVDELKALVRDEREPDRERDTQAAEPETPRRTFAPLRDLLKTPPTQYWLVKYLVPADATIVIFGESGCGKSFVTIDLLCHIAAGLPWRGNKTKQGLVMYLAGEGQNGIIMRFKAWFEAHPAEQPAIDNILIRTVPAAIGDPTAVSAIVAEIADMLVKPIAIGIDTLARNFGPGDENSTRDMNQFVNGLDALRSVSKASIVVPHHSGHSLKDRARGSSVLKAAIETEFSVEREEVPGESGTASRITLRCPKMKDAETPPPFAWTLVKQLLPWCDEDGIPLNSAVLEPCDAPESSAASTKSLPAAQRIALEALKTALVEHGTEEKGVVSVAEDEWRQAAYDGGICSGDVTQEARKKAFQRAQKGLVASQKVTCHEGRYWIPSSRATKAEQRTEAPANLVPCQKCRGSGKVGFDRANGRCFDCNGSGKVPESRYTDDVGLDATDNGTKRDKTGQCPDVSPGVSGGQTGQDGTPPFKGCPDVPATDAPNTEPDSNPEIPAASSVETSPLARRILATLEQTPSGLTLRDLATATGNPGRGVSEAMVKATCDALLLAGKVAFHDGKYFFVGSAQR